MTTVSISPRKHNLIQEKLVTKFESISIQLRKDIDYVSNKNNNNDDNKSLFNVKISHPDNEVGGELCIGTTNRVSIEAFIETISAITGIKKFYREQYSWKCVQYDFLKNLEKIFYIDDQKYIDIFKSKFISLMKARRQHIFDHFKTNSNEFLKSDSESKDLENCKISNISEAYRVYYDIEEMRKRHK